MPLSEKQEKFIDSIIETLQAIKTSEESDKILTDNSTKLAETFFPDKKANVEVVLLTLFAGVSALIETIE